MIFIEKLQFPLKSEFVPFITSKLCVDLRYCLGDFENRSYWYIASVALKMFRRAWYVVSHLKALNAVFATDDVIATQSNVNTQALRTVTLNRRILLIVEIQAQSTKGEIALVGSKFLSKSILTHCGLSLVIWKHGYLHSLIKQKYYFLQDLFPFS